MSISAFRCCNRQIWSTSKQSWARGISIAPKQSTQIVCRRHQSTEATAKPLSPSTSSVSQDEVKHFTQLASTWWDPHGPSRLLHLMNPLRHDFIQSCLESGGGAGGGQKYTYLDIGCGGGIFASSAARLPSTESVTAIDPTLPVIQVAKAKQRTDPALQEPRLRYLNCAVEDLQTHLQQQPQQASSDGEQQESAFDETHQDTKNQYDIVTMFEVIEHISHPSKFLSTALQHLKPGGWLIGSTISRHPISYLTTKLIAEAPIVGVVPSGTHNWNQYINPDELQGWFTGQNALATSDGGGENNQWGLVKIQGVIYLPVVGWKFVTGSEKYGNYFFGVQKLK